MSGLALQPIPHAEGIALLKDKPAVTRAVFDALLPELKGLAFTITGIEAIDVLQKSRDIIAGLPQGRRWEDVKRELLAEISPWLISGDDEEERAASARAAARRAELLMRLHGFNAYEVAHSRVLEEMGDVFSHWRWQTMGDSKVRPSHSAMDGITLPKDSPFWRTIWPRRGYLCRCQLIGITPEEAEEDLKADRDLAPEERKYLEGPALTQLEMAGIINRGPSSQFNLAKEAATGPHRQFGSLKISPDELRDRYDPDVWSEFEAFARAQEIRPGQTVWGWLSSNGPDTSPSTTTASVTTPMGNSARTLATVEATLQSLAPALDAARMTQAAARQRVKDLVNAGKINTPEYTVASQANADALAQVEIALQAARDVVSVPVAERGKVTLLNKTSPSLKQAMSQGTQLTETYTHASLLPEVRSHLLRGKRPRAYHVRKQGISEIHVSPLSGASTVMHEITHATEQAQPAVLKAAVDFLNLRAQTGQRVHLSKLYPLIKWQSTEYTFEDEWISRGGHAYSGKDYAGRATEILTMGIERLHADPVAFLKSDPDYLRFVLRTLQQLT